MSTDMPVSWRWSRSWSLERSSEMRRQVPDTGADATIDGSGMATHCVACKAHELPPVR
jgi:hypothetical protein